MHAIEKMAYVGEAPWHTLGSRLPANQSLETWTRAAGMDWSICEAPVRFMPREDSPNNTQTFEDQKVLYRSDNHKALSVVARRYRVVQPHAVLEFFRDLTEVAGFELETGGCLKNGKKLWALARTGNASVLRGKDRIEGFVLLATSCDGTLATTATHTSVRVVCQNTLAVALGSSQGAVKVPHSTTFEPALVKSQLGIAVSQWSEFIYRMKHLAERKVSDKEAERFMRKLVGLPEDVAKPAEPLANGRSVKKMLDLFAGEGRGADLASAKGTAFGLLQACTQFVDHERRARNQDYRLDSAWFGAGASLKERALSQALELVV
ncbi:MULTISPECIES: DUF932 domain-containing protein [unclassified Polaromonas]|uniref:DUF932 domain-containing protein n=1 Tax=unclassified Polaromonas TaxID=2638319 RepID=UPI000F07D7C4|nr:MULTISPECIES: DUF932 domain-containing protein [unclassified Polaromonas]AYQ26566.1 DUF932 domain-containing protein [Polaromonas sp. SP1]QGJ18585.1 DUF932 domain-containing protein [Polaromonas sp. Pch-P]